MNIAALGRGQDFRNASTAATCDFYKIRAFLYKFCCIMMKVFIIVSKVMPATLSGDKRRVECEACGFKCLYVSLFGHQVAKRCMRQLLQKEYVNSLKSTHNSLIKYSREMTEDRMKLQQRRHSLEMRYKNLQPLRYRLECIAMEMINANIMRSKFHEMRPTRVENVTQHFQNNFFESKAPKKFS